MCAVLCSANHTDPNPMSLLGGVGGGKDTPERDKEEGVFDSVAPDVSRRLEQLEQFGLGGL